MRYEPLINRSDLLDVVLKEYHLAVEQVTFVPVGYAAVCYTLTCSGGQRYFLKLWPDTDSGRATTARQDTILPLIRAMHERGVYQRVPYPIATRTNALRALFQGGSFAIFSFLSGDSPPEDVWPPALRDEFAQTVAAIHSGTARLTDVLPPHERFDLPFADELAKSLRTIEGIGPRERPGLQALRALVLPRRDDICAQLQRLCQFQAKMRVSPDAFVLCHSDLTTNNLLVDEHGHLYVLDWDWAIMATPEYDLKHAVGEGFDRFLEVYVATGGTSQLSIERFAFYLLRRYMADWVARVLNILRENMTEEQDQEDLEGMETWGIAQWNSLDKTLAAITVALHHLAR